MRVVALCSGGKDSTFALWLAVRGGYEVEKLIFILPEKEDSWMFHYPNVHLYEMFSKCVGIPAEAFIFYGGRDEEIPFLEEVISRTGAAGVVSGVVASSFQKGRLDAICRRLGIQHIAPLWGKNQLDVLRAEIESGIEFIITGVSAEGLGREWLGKRIGAEEGERLVGISRKYGINLSGEGGEYETLVVDAPFFKFRIEIEEAEIAWDGQRGVYLVKKARLAEKLR